MESINEQQKLTPNQQIKNIQKHCLFKVEIEIEDQIETSSGFLCLIPDKVLITNNSLLIDEGIQGKNIILSFKNKKRSNKMIIDEDRKILTIKKTDDGDEINISIIDIKPEDELEEEEFLEFDANLIKNNNEYKKKNNLFN